MIHQYYSLYFAGAETGLYYQLVSRVRQACDTSDLTVSSVGVLDTALYPDSGQNVYHAPYCSTVSCTTDTRWTLFVVVPDGRQTNLRFSRRAALDCLHRCAVARARLVNQPLVPRNRS